MKVKVFSLAFLLLIVPMVFSSFQEVSCNFGNPPFGGIEVIFNNQNAINKAEIWALTPQNYAAVTPGDQAALQLKSNTCVEYTLKIQNSEGLEIGKYAEKPYSPYKDCVIPEGASLEGMEFLTLIIFRVPDIQGKYILEITDPNGIVLTKGSINVPDISNAILSVSRNSYCTIDNEKYVVTLDAPFPVVVPDTYKRISVSVEGPDSSKAKNVIDQISASISPKNSRAQISLVKSESSRCYDNLCKQGFQLTSTASTFGILYAFLQQTDIVYYSVNSELLSIIDLNKLEQVQNKLTYLSNIASKYIGYYNSINEKKNAATWQQVYEKIEYLREKINISISALKTNNYKISDVIFLIKTVDETSNSLDEIVGLLSGV